MKKFNPTEHVIQNDSFGARMCRLMLMECENMILPCSMFSIYIYIYTFLQRAHIRTTACGVRRTVNTMQLPVT